MDKGSKILSDIIVFSKYSQYKKELNRRETWDEIIDRNKEMHLKKFPDLVDEISGAYKYVYEKKILPSMRSLQFAGKATEKNQSRLYNCSALPIDSILAFSEIMFLLLSGCGVGYSVSKFHIDKLPEIRIATKTRKHIIADSIEGWADAVKSLMKAYLNGSPLPRFDFSDIRPKGTPLSSGGLAPGPEPLRIALEHVHSILRSKKAGDKLTPLNCHDIICHISNAVLAGGIRRSALICLFDIEDNEMLNCKVGNWWELNPQRARANNSVSLNPDTTTRGDFWYVWKRCQYSNAGEPGIYWNKSPNNEFLTNPCVTEDTWIMTDKGAFQVVDLINTPFFAKINGQHHSSPGFFSTGKKAVWHVVFDNGCELKATPNHKILTKLGWKELKDVSLSDEVVLHDHKSEHSWDGLYSYKQGWLLGSLIGDGTFSNNSAHLCYWNDEAILGEKAVAYLHETFKVRSDCKGGMSKDTNKNNKFTVRSADLARFASIFNIKANNKQFNAELERATSSEFIVGVLGGWFDADGSVQGTQQKGVSIRLSSSILSNLKAAQRMLLRLGINSKIRRVKTAGWKELPDGKGGLKEYSCLASFELMIAKDNIVQFDKLIGFSSPKKQDKLRKLLNNYKRKINKEPFVTKIVDCFQTEECLVFDCSVEGVNAFDANGIYVHNCGEVALRSKEGEKGSGGGYCNLVEVNTTNIKNQEDFNNRVKAASFINTLQASYTDFHYLRPEWKEVADEDALLGIGLTGIADGVVLNFNLSEAAKVAVEENKRVSELIGITPSARICTVKPSGTASSVLGCASGIHARHAPYYLRRIRLGKSESIYKYLSEITPKLLEDEYFDPDNTAVLSIPIKSPDNSIFRTESPIDFLRRVRKVYKEWVVTGHQRGEFTHNVSATINIKDSEWDTIGGWLWRNRKGYVGISCLPYSDANYVQMPFEEIDEDTYNKFMKYLVDIDLTQVVEFENNTKLDQEGACSSGACEITRL